MKNLIIIGARGFGREAFCAFDIENQINPQYIIKGFLDSKSDALDGYLNYPPIIGAPEDYSPESDDVFFCAMGDVKWRRYYSEMIAAKGGVFVSYISSTSFIGQNVKIGRGCFIGRFASLTCDIDVGDFSYIFTHASIGHDARIGNFCHVGAHGFMGGYSKIEDGVTLHPSACVLPHMKISKNAVVGAGSVVIRNVKENSTVLGVPAKKLDL